jgi:hypothetical protein
MLTQKILQRGTIALIGFEFGLALAYFTMIWRHGIAASMLDFNGLRSLPSLMQAAHLFAIGGLCLGVLIWRRRLSRPCSWFLPLALATLSFLGGFDEVTKLHLMLDQFNWQFIYLGLLAAIPILGWRDLRWVWSEHRETLLWIVTGLGIFLLGGFGAEMLKGAIASELSTHTNAHIVFLSEHLRITLEEFAELVGETIILYAFSVFVLRLFAPAANPR